MNCPNCGDQLLRMDSGEPDYEPLDSWWCMRCKEEFESDDLFSEDPFERE